VISSNINFEIQYSLKINISELSCW